MTPDQVIELAKEWRLIPSFPAYEVSDVGDVRRGSRLLKQKLRDGYPRVCLQRDRKSVYVTAHTLVAEAFIGPRPHGMHICHTDGNKRNNSVLNLRYGTPKENDADKLIHGRRAFGLRNGSYTMPDKRPKGSRHGTAKLNEDLVRSIKHDLIHMPKRSGKVIAQKYGISDSTVCLINKGKLWTHV